MSETVEELKTKWDRRGKKLCDRGEHETSFPVFEHPKLGGLTAWRCYCGQATEVPLTGRTPIPGA